MMNNDINENSVTNELYWIK